MLTDTKLFYAEAQDDEGEDEEEDESDGKVCVCVCVCVCVWGGRHACLFILVLHACMVISVICTY